MVRAHGIARKCTFLQYFSLTGSLVNVASVNPVYKAGGRWNTYEIYAKGPEITVKLNGVVTVSAYDKKFAEGRIGIQWNGGPIKVRKLLVREL